MLDKIWKTKEEVRLWIFRPSDYFEGTITKDGKKVSTGYGSYCGFIDFDNVRYWDGRYLQAIKIILA